jgi:hypothetical protein
MKTPEIIERIDSLIEWARDEKSNLWRLEINTHSALKSIEQIKERTHEQTNDYVALIRADASAHSSRVAYERIITRLVVLRANILYPEKDGGLAGKPEA